MSEQVMDERVVTKIPDRWSVGLDGLPVERFIPDKPIRTIAVQYDVFGVGGAERVALEQLYILSGLGYHVVLYTNVPESDGDLSVPDGVQRKCAPSENDDHNERFAFWKHEVEEEEIDLIIYNSWVSGWMQFDCWAFAKLGVSFVMYCHSMFTSWFGDDTADYLSRALPWAAQRCAAVICINEATASFFSLYTDRVLLLANPLRTYLKGVDATNTPEGKTIVWVGRMSSEKRPDDIISVMKRVVEVHPDARMLVVGGDNDEAVPQPQTLADKARYFGLNSCITFTGFANPYPYLAKARVYIQTSEYEGFPLGLAEAMYFSLPCVTYNYDYLPHTKDNAGLISVPVGDVDAMAKAICSVLEDEELANEMGKHSREVFDRIADVDFSHVYKQLVEGVESDELPAELLFEANNSVVDEKRMADYFLQGIRLACDVRHRLQWDSWHELERAQERIAELEKDVETLRASLKELMESRAYKFGNIVASPYRFIIDHGKNEK